MKPKPTVSFTMRLSPELYEAMDEAATRLEQTHSEFLREALQAHITKSLPRKPKAA
jgi:predicted DNA-binding protein